MGEMGAVTVRWAAAPGLVDRFHSLLSGAVTVPGVDLRLHEPVPRDRLFREAAGDRSVDLAEVSFATYVLRRSLGDDRLLALPVFTSRSYRHGQIFVRADGPVETPADLVGGRIGVPHYEMTAVVWARALLEHELGVDAHRVAWRVGGIATPGYVPRLDYEWPQGFDVAAIDDRSTLEQALGRGEVDALVIPRELEGLDADPPTIRRLLPDHRARAEAYAARTGFFPIMHALGVRRELVEAHPWLPERLVGAFETARREALSALRSPDTPAVMYPWMREELDRFAKLLGQDPYRYGIDANRAELAAFLGYMDEQGLLRSSLEVDDLFAP